MAEVRDWTRGSRDKGRGPYHPSFDPISSAQRDEEPSRKDVKRIYVQSMRPNRVRFSIIG